MRRAEPQTDCLLPLAEGVFRERCSGLWASAPFGPGRRAAPYRCPRTEASANEPRPGGPDGGVCRSEGTRSRGPNVTRDTIGSKDPDALKIPARRAEDYLTRNGSSPFQAEPRQGRFGEGPGNDPTNDVSAVVVDLCCGM